MLSRITSQSKPTLREPSPTPSEVEALKQPLIEWRKLLSWRTWFRRSFIIWYIAAAIVIPLVVLMTIYHKEIVIWLKPAATWMHSVPFGWTIPIAVLFVISFPPLFGHEIVAILVGLIWGLWVGFGIVAAGTLLGEIGNFYAFKYICFARGAKAEKNSLTYACLAKVVREGGFKIALLARLSAIPGHLTTGIFATLGMNIWIFTIAAILSMPKQFITVYVGVVLEESSETPTPEQKAANANTIIISRVVLGVTTLITIGAGWWIWREMKRVRRGVILERYRARKVKTAGFMSSDSVPTNYLMPGRARSYEDDEATLHEPTPRWNGKPMNDDPENSWEMDNRTPTSNMPLNPHAQSFGGMYQDTWDKGQGRTPSPDLSYASHSTYVPSASSVTLEHKSSAYEPPQTQRQQVSGAMPRYQLTDPGFRQ